MSFPIGSRDCFGYTEAISADAILNAGLTQVDAASLGSLILLRN